MVSKIKNYEEEKRIKKRNKTIIKILSFIAIIMLILVIIVSLLVELGTNPSEYKTDTSKYVSSVEKEKINKNKDDNVFQFFEREDIKKKMNEKKNDEKLDCSLKDNYNKSKIYFEIYRSCKVDDSLIFSTSYCKEVNGEIKPNIGSTAYPSLNEYYFSHIVTHFKNLGCTKLNPKDYTLIYALYQNGKGIASKISDKEIDNLTNLLEDNNLIYPEGWLMPTPYFGSSTYLSTPIKFSSSTGFTFKICLIDEKNKTVISCDQTDFNIEYNN